MNPDIQIRELDSLAELQQALALEKEIWGLADKDVTPLTMAVATRAAGAMWLGAFKQAELAGFAFALPSLDGGVVGYHSHMLGVRSSYRGSGIGRELKTAQR